MYGYIQCRSRSYIRHIAQVDMSLGHSASFIFLLSARTFYGFLRKAAYPTINFELSICRGCSLPMTFYGAYSTKSNILAFWRDPLCMSWGSVYVSHAQLFGGTTPPPPTPSLRSIGLGCCLYWEALLGVPLSPLVKNGVLCPDLYGPQYFQGVSKVLGRCWTSCWSNGGSIRSSGEPFSLVSWYVWDLHLPRMFLYLLAIGRVYPSSLAS